MHPEYGSKKYIQAMHPECASQICILNMLPTHACQPCILTMHTANVHPQQDEDFEVSHGHLYKFYHAIPPLKKKKGSNPYKRFLAYLAMKGYLCIILRSILFYLDKTEILRYHTAIFINFIMRSPPKKEKGSNP